MIKIIIIIIIIITIITIITNITITITVITVTITIKKKLTFKPGWSEVLMQSQSTAGQSRANPFNRTWEMFKNGFSCLAGCYWLGNEVVYKLTKSEKCRLLIVLAPVMVDSRYYLYYDPFQIGSEGAF